MVEISRDTPCLYMTTVASHLPVFQAEKLKNIAASALNEARTSGKFLLFAYVNYMHQNPVRATLVERPADYLWSSCRIWQRMPSPNEPLNVDFDQIRWRQSE